MKIRETDTEARLQKIQEEKIKGEIVKYIKAKRERNRKKQFFKNREKSKICKQMEIQTERQEIIKQREKEETYMESEIQQGK